MRKSIIKKAALVLIIVLIVFGVVFKNKLVTKATDVRNSLSILEIEPTDKFSLTQSSATSGIETLPNLVPNMTVTIRHMTMLEYISSVEQVNGKYDIVVIGDNNTSSSVTYSPEFGTKTKYLPYGKEVYNTKSSPSTLGMLNDSKWTGTSRNNYDGDQNTYIEYYSENDITNKRASEIIDSINSGQLVYIANEVFSVTGTKLYSSFYNMSKDNLIKTAQSNITLSNLVSKYSLATTKKAPLLRISSQSQNNNRNIDFIYNITTDNEEQNMQANLYLDLNGDGLFKDKEKVKTISNINTSNKQFNNGEIGYRLDDQFVGNLTWKLEIVTYSGVKTYKTGTLDFQADPNNKPVVRVLQVYPVTTNGISNSFNLSTNSTISSLITGLRDYTLSISTKSTTEFNTYISGGNSLNSHYDMVILGFADSYAYNDLPQTSIDELKHFIQTGQSVMFTHDTVTYRYLTPIDTTDKSSKTITRNFRDIIGQSRYVDPNNPQQTDIYQNFDVATGTYQTRTIPHEQLKSTDQGKISLGMTKGLLTQFESSATAGSYSGESTSVYKINDGLINLYPYTIGDISVAPTHYQWYQLNLEDPDVVPWYTLKPNGNGYNQYDARNYYYTYSKGNITYSGTGHSGDSSKYTADECKLFVNTMVKAERGANHAPIITGLTNLSDGEQISKNQDNIQFSFVPIDRDNDPINAVITVKAGNTVTTFPYSNKKQGEKIDVSIPKSVYSSTSGSTITISIDASDPLLAKAQTVNATINLVNDPTISLSSLNDNSLGYLVGDTASVTVTANANKSTQNLNTILSNINYNITGNYDTSKVQVTSGGNILNFNDVAFTPDPNPLSQPQTFNFLTKQSGQIAISGKLTYYQKDVTTQKSSDYTITLPVRDGKANIKITTGNNNALVLGDAQVQVYKGDTLVNTVSVNGSKQIPILGTGTYKFKLLTSFNGFVVQNNTIQQDFSYSSNENDIIFNEIPDTISHGLYSDNTLRTGDIDLTKNSNATFGVLIKTDNANPLVTIDLDDALRNVSSDSFKINKIDGNGKLVPVTNAQITQLTGSGNINKFTVQFSGNDTTSCYMIVYTIKLGSNDSYTNNVSLNNVNKPITITCQELKDLF
ncbi:DUF5057 domain-containing protein [Clostridium fungisolvens]|uniref:Uncharacterized protein n=1 Tax=Clostridium fungisolvens TaxID=1604897 RepID=A0A6V8SLD5_9CLOT|nr:DUF5057 domain-containing protein [Clostridium fungisolvens]GFP77561.1 hypothetical protein bsdtw1_03719 [Clostridium fungisolvens]